MYVGAGLTWSDMFLIWMNLPAGSTSEIWMNPVAVDRVCCSCVTLGSRRGFLGSCSEVWVRPRRFSRGGVGVMFSLGGGGGRKH